jgi:hypothetical protein
MLCRVVPTNAAQLTEESRMSQSSLFSSVSATKIKEMQLANEGFMYDN